MAADDELKKVLTDPKRVSGDAGSVTRYGADEMIRVDRYLASKESAKNRKGLGIPLVKIHPDGTV